MNECLNDPIIIAVSSCLTGEAVRYDGTAKQNTTITHRYSRFFTLHTLCPEVAIGLGVPRNPIKIIKDNTKCGHFSLSDINNSELDYTILMLSYAKLQCHELSALCAYVVKERSPSCGLNETPRFSMNGNILSLGAGLFTEKITQKLPWLPIITESEIDNYSIEDNFLERLFVLYLWNNLVKKDKRYGDFYDRIKHQLEIRDAKINISKKLNSSNSQKQNEDFITHVMTVLKEPVTLMMQIDFLNLQLEKYNIISEQLRVVIKSYHDKKITLLDVIKEFQTVFIKKRIEINSNYFYPDARELKAREFYFDS